MEYSIYGLRVIETGEVIYIGSTKNLKKREYCHKRNTETETKESEFLIYNLIRELGGWSSIEMDVIGTFVDDERFETERRFITQYNPRGNDKRPFVTEDERNEKRKEWFDDHPDYIKEYYEQNKSKQISSAKQWQQENKERYNANQKKWKEDNKEKLKLYMREYRLKKKEMKQLSKNEERLL